MEVLGAVDAGDPLVRSLLRSVKPTVSLIAIIQGTHYFDLNVATWSPALTWDSWVSFTPELGCRVYVGELPQITQ